MGGKRQANILASIIKNFDTVDQVIETSMDSQNSAYEENMKWLDSIEGKTTQFTNSIQTMWMNIIKSDTIKNVVDLGTALVKLVDTLGLFPSVVGAASLIYYVKSFSGLGEELKSINSESENLIRIFGRKKVVTDADTAANIENAASEELSANTSAKEAAQEGASAAAKGADTIATKTNTMATKANVAATKALTVAKNLAKGLLIGAAISLVTKGVTKLISSMSEAKKKAKETSEEILNQYNEIQRTIRSNKNTIDEISSDYKKLADGVDKFGNNISLTTEEYKRYNEITNQIADMFPTMVAGYTAEGNAIISTKGNVEELTRAYEEQAKAARNAVIAGADNVFQTVKNDLEMDGNYFGDFSIKEEIEAYKAAKSLLSGNTVKDVAKKYGDAIEREAEEILKDLGFESYTGAYASGDTYKTYGLKQKWNNNTQEYEKDYTYEEEQEFARRRNTFNLKYNAILGEQEIALKKINEVMRAYLGNDETYVSMTDELKSIVDSIVKDLDPSNFDYDDEKMYSYISSNIVQPIYNSKESVQNALSDILELDTSKTSYEIYKAYIAGLGDAIKELPEETQKAIMNYANKNDKQYQAYSKHIAKIVGKGFEDEISNLSLSDLKIAGELEVDEGTLLTWDQLILKIKEVRAVNQAEPAIASYEELQAAISNINDIIGMSSELSIDNIRITEEQGKALEELIGDTDEYADAVDKSNGYVIKNSKLTKTLIDRKKAEASQNVKAAKSQSRLQYYNLYKQMRQLTGAEGELAQKNQAQINTLYQEMQVVAKTIQKYSLLEEELLGVTNAYTKFADAQTIDNANNYDSQISEMVVALGNALNTGEFSEQAWAAIDGLIPDDLLIGLDTAHEKIQKIYDEFTTGAISKYFTVEFDEEGSIQNAEITRDNVVKFIQDGIDGVNGVKVFEGTWESFDLSENIESLKDLASAYGITKEMAYAYLKEAEKFDISPINGDFKTLLDQLMGDDLEYQLFEQTQAAAEAAHDVANNVDGAAEKYIEAQQKLNESADIARENANKWKEANDQYELQKKVVDELIKQIQQADEGVDTTEMQKELDDAIAKLGEYGLARDQYQISEFIIQVAMDDIDKDISEIESKYADLANNVELDNKTGKYNIKSEVVWNGETPDQQTIDNYLTLLNEKHTLEVMQGEELPTVLDVLEEIRDILQTKHDLTVTTDASKSKIQSIIDSLNELTLSEFVVSIKAKVSDTLQTWWGRITGKEKKEGLEPEIDKVERKPIKKPYNNGGRFGNIMMEGTAHANGDWGLKSSERNALVGELGRETVVDPHTGRYYTVGDNGAELVDLPKDAIIFNHLQTKQLFENGHINSRGKAYASGNAYVDTWNGPNGELGTVGKDWAGNLSDSMDDASDKISDAVDDAANQFEEAIDWFEILVEEIDHQISLMEAWLEGAVGIDRKEALYDALIDAEYGKMQAYQEGIAFYTKKAAELFAQIPKQYQSMAQNGAVDVTDFVGDGEEETVNAINEYREFVKKVQEGQLQLIESDNRVAELRMENFRMISQEYENQIELINNTSDLINKSLDLRKEKGERSSAKFYEAMIESTKNALGLQKKRREELVQELANIEKGSDAWYEAIGMINDVDEAIIQCEIDIESFNNAIQELHWENFEKLVDEISYVSDEAENIRNILGDDEDMVDDNGEWTKEGITAIGLLAQQMENAKYRTKLYGEQIEHLKKEYAAGNYSQDEYNEKLRELKEAQWDSIEAYESAKDQLMDLNRTKVEIAKDGLQKEIDAYEELIDKRKKALDAAKDEHDWFNTVKDHNDEIDDLQNRINAMNGDTSASAAAQRKKLEEELAKAREELDEVFYDKTIETQKEALDKSLEIYRKGKEEAMEELDEYLKKEEQVFEDSYELVRNNTDLVNQTLLEISQRYGIQISDAVTKPWQEGQNALGKYSDNFNIATSGYIRQLDTIKGSLQMLQAEADRTAQKLIDMINAGQGNLGNIGRPPNNDIDYGPGNGGGYQPPWNGGGGGGGGYQPPIQPPEPPKTISKGQSVTVKTSAKTFSRNGGNGTKMQSWVPGGTFTVMSISKNGDEVLIGRNGGYTGWVWKKDLEGFAKGTTGVDRDQLAWIDENGLEEIVMHADNGKLSYLTKGSAVIPHDISENLMELGKVDPRVWLENNRPSVTPGDINNTTNNIVDMSFGSLIHIEHADKDSIPEIQSAVKQQLDSYMKNLNANLKRFAR